MALVALDVAPAGAAVPDQRLRLGLGRCSVFPLSPFYLRYKVSALIAYALHRPRCVFVEDVPLAPLLARAELRHRLPCGLLGAIVQVESGGSPHRISSAGAMGPLQLIPPTARMLGVSDPFDPEESLDGGARYLRAQLTRFHSVRLAAAAYNAGPGAIVGRAVPHNGQTEIYVQRVMHALRSNGTRAASRPAVGTSHAHAGWSWCSRARRRLGCARRSSATASTITHSRKTAMLIRSQTPMSGVG